MAEVVLNPSPWGLSCFNAAQYLSENHWGTSILIHIETCSWSIIKWKRKWQKNTQGSIPLGEIHIYEHAVAQVRMWKVMSQWQGGGGPWARQTLAESLLLQSLLSCQLPASHLPLQILSLLICKWEASIIIRVDKDHLAHGFIYMKCPEEVKPRKQQID